MKNDPAVIPKLFSFALLACALTHQGCAKVAVEGGDKPIHIVMDINVKVDRELDQFFEYEKKYTPPATQPASDAAR